MGVSHPGQTGVLILQSRRGPDGNVLLRNDRRTSGSRGKGMSVFVGFRGCRARRGGVVDHSPVLLPS